MEDHSNVAVLDLTKLPNRILENDDDDGTINVDEVTAIRTLQRYDTRDDAFPGDRVPPLTPCTSKKVGEALRMTYGNWNIKADDLGIPHDPRLWSAEQVSFWLFWTIQEFSLDKEVYANSVKNFQMTGSELCSLNRDSFLALIPDCTGDILYEHLQVLLQDAQQEDHYVRHHPAQPQTFQTMTSSFPTTTHTVEPTTTATTTTTTTPPPPAATDLDDFSHKVPVYQASAPFFIHHSYSSSPYHNSGGGLTTTATNGGENNNNNHLTPSTPAACPSGGPIQLWQFLLEMLSDKSCQSCISWTGNGWEFKMSDPDEVARRWGIRKNKPKMNYEKLSRGLRYYYDKNIIQKTAGKRYVYRFVCNLETVLRCDAKTYFQHLNINSDADSEKTNEK